MTNNVWWVLGTGASLLRYPPEYFRERQAIGVNGTIDDYAEVLDKYVLLDCYARPEWLAKALVTMLSDDFYLYRNIADHFRVPAERATIFGCRDGGRWTRGYEGALSTGFTVVFTAIHLALTLGATDVVLAGVDLAPRGDLVHYYDGDRRAWQRSRFSSECTTEDRDEMNDYLTYFAKMRTAIARARAEFEKEHPGAVRFHNASDGYIDGFVPVQRPRVAGLMRGMLAG